MKWNELKVTLVTRACLMLVACVLPSCHTGKPLPAMDFSQPGWRVLHGQAVWHPAGGQEVTGELLLATRADGCGCVQFAKPPITLVTAQKQSGRWEARFPPNRIVRGSAAPPEKLIWFCLMDQSAGARHSAEWSWETKDRQSWLLRNRRTGESLEGYLAP